MTDGKKKADNGGCDAGAVYKSQSPVEPSVVVVNDEELASQLDCCVVHSAPDEQAVSEYEGVDCVVLSDRQSTDIPERIASLQAQSEQSVALVAFDGSEKLASEAISAGVDEYIPVESAPPDIEKQVAPLCADDDASMNVDGVAAAVEHAADAVVITDKNGVIEYVNPAFEQLSGYSSAEAIGCTPRILKSGEQGQQYYEQMWETILDGDVWEEQIVNETQSGRTYTAHQTIAPVVGEDGSIERFVGIQRDITRQKRLEEQLARSKRTLSQLYDSTADSDADLDTKIAAVLELATDNLGYEVGYFTRISDETQRIVAASGDHDPIEAGREDPLCRTYCRETIDSDEPVVIGDAAAEGWAGDPAYENFGLDCYAGARVLVDNELYGTLCFGGTDVTDRLILDAHRSTVQTLANWVGYEIERDQYDRKLEQQNERLERFAGAVSHDLRNPLDVARSYVTLAAEDESLDYLDKVADAHDRMEEIIEDTLTLAREGELVEEPTTVSLSRLATDCWETVDTAGAQLEVESDMQLRADPDKLRHVFENLYRNAVEHGSTNQESDVTISVGQFEDGFYIEDDGPGIDDDEKAAVFEFGHTTADGSGFGLAIVDTIARAHDWSVRVTDSAAGGARFEFETDGQTERCLVC